LLIETCDQGVKEPPSSDTPIDLPKTAAYTPDVPASPTTTSCPTNTTPFYQQGFQININTANSAGNMNYIEELNKKYSCCGRSK